MDDKQEQIVVSEKGKILENNNQGSVTKNERNETIVNFNSTNHNEISIMENIWEQIKQKVYKISFKKRIDINAIITGAMVPYGIDIIVDYNANEAPNYVPIVICIILLIVNKQLSRIIPFIGDDLSNNNNIHLEDIKNLISLAENKNNIK